MTLCKFRTEMCTNEDLEYIKLRHDITEAPAMRVVALKDFADVKAGDRGGIILYTEGRIKNNWPLSQEGNCWLYDNAILDAKGSVRGDAQVMGSATVWGTSVVKHDACIYDRAFVRDSVVQGASIVEGKTTEIYNTTLHGRCRIGEGTLIHPTSGDCQCWDTHMEGATVYTPSWFTRGKLHGIPWYHEILGVAINQASKTHIRIGTRPNQRFFEWASIGHRAMEIHDLFLSLSKSGGPIRYPYMTPHQAQALCDFLLTYMKESLVFSTLEEDI